VSRLLVYEKAHKLYVSLKCNQMRHFSGGKTHMHPLAIQVAYLMIISRASTDTRTNI